MKNTETIWLCMGNTDTVEGRGPMTVVCGAPDQKTAIDIVNSNAFCRQYGVMGTAPYNAEWNVKEIPVYSNPEDYGIVDMEKVKEEALGKLTYEEKVALGLIRR